MPRPPTLIALATALLLALAGCGSGGGGDSSAATSTRPISTTEPSKHSKPPPNLPPPTPGSKAAAPGVPTSKEGDNSIQTYGREASASQRARATATVQSYLDARAARNWGTVCHLLAAKPRAEQERFADGVSCAKAMASFAAHAPTAVLEEEARIEVLSFRVGSKYAFLVYRRPDGIWATALTGEGGNWKVVSVTPASVE
jgi:hypothetical protein